MMRAPVIPNGWPSAIAPPWGLSFSSGMSHSSMIGITWAAKASLSSTVSTSPMSMPARSSTLRMAPIGATPMYSGSMAAVAAVTIRARGRSPSSVGLVGRHHEHGGGAVVQRTGVAGRDLAVLLERRVELGELLEGRARARAVVLGHLGAVGQRDRHDLAVEVAVLL